MQHLQCSASFVFILSKDNPALFRSCTGCIYKFQPAKEQFRQHEIKSFSC